MRICQTAHLVTLNLWLMTEMFDAVVLERE